eukprot:gene16913-727_t
MSSIHLQHVSLGGSSRSARSVHSVRSSTNSVSSYASAYDPFADFDDDDIRDEMWDSMVAKQVRVVKEKDTKLLRGTVYSPRNRQIIIVWMRDVAEAFHMKKTTLCLA